MIASRNEQVDAIHLLKRELYYLNSFGYGAAHIACRYNRLQSFDALPEEHDMATENGDSCLMVAAASNSIQIVSKLLG